jgi:hypothetical protein
MIEMALRQVLIADPAVFALIGNRCYPAEAPQAPVYPLVIIQEVTNESEYSMDGAVGLGRARFQFNCDGKSALEVQSLRTALRNALGGFKGLVTITGLSPPQAVRIQGAFLVMGHDEPQGELQASGLRTLRKSLDFNIWFEE